MPLTLIDRFQPRLRREQQAAIDAGLLHKHDELALLEPKSLRPLALLSLLMLIGSALFFAALNLAAYFWQQHTLSLHLTFGGVLLWLGINSISYIVILPIHEGLHGLTFLAWGGKPYFGTKLPLALYCGAKQQLFRRDQYLAVGLAPVVVITLAALILTLLAPVLASYVIFATIGNFSGAAGDVWVAARLWRKPREVLVEDTELGYTAWRLESEKEQPEQEGQPAQLTSTLPSDTMLK
jgi:hypothetical protein